MSPDFASILAGSAIGVSLLALSVVGWQWRSFRARLAELQAEIARTRLPVDTANTKAEEAGKSARQSAASAEQSARAAVAAAEAARSIVELGKRAWVHATEFKLSLKTQSNENSNLEVWIANLGPTPARELKLSSNFLICDEIPPDFSLKPRVNNVVLGPGISFSLSHFLRVSPADLASIRTGHKLLLTCGQAQYLDFMGVARQTLWCAVYDFNAKAFVSTTDKNSAS